MKKKDYYEDLDSRDFKIVCKGTLVEYELILYVICTYYL